MLFKLFIAALKRNIIKNIRIIILSKFQFIYVIDAKAVSANMKSLDLHCPNCNSPITNLGHKKCSYCWTSVVELIKRVFVCNDIKRY